MLQLINNEQSLRQKHIDVDLNLIKISFKEYKIIGADSQEWRLVSVIWNIFNLLVGNVLRTFLFSIGNFSLHLHEISTHYHHHPCKINNIYPCKINNIYLKSTCFPLMKILSKLISVKLLLIHYLRLYISNLLQWHYFWFTNWSKFTFFYKNSITWKLTVRCLSVSLLCHKSLHNCSLPKCILIV